MQKTAPGKRLQSIEPSQTATSQVRIALQLGLSHLIAGACALGIYTWLFHVLSQSYVLLISLAIAVVAGLLCTLNFQYGLYLLELTLARFAHGQFGVDAGHHDHSVSLGIFGHRWPLNAFFQRVEEADRRVQRYTESAQLTTDLREKALQQAREAAAQAERNRIARELHDSIKQQIFSMSMSAAAAKAFWQGENSDEARSAVEDIQRSAQEAQVEMQALLQQLRPAPLENTSLLEALRVQAQALGFRTGAQVHVEIGELPGDERLLPGTQEAIFRLVQEAFANIARHARAHTIWLTLRSDERRLQIEIRDDGQGFEMAGVQKGMGLTNLDERARELHGTVRIKSQPGQGTSVAISIPLLEALRSPEEEAQAKYELQRATELAQRGYQLCENASPLGMLMVFLSIPFHISWSVIALCVLASLYGYISGVYYRTQVVLQKGKGSREALELAQRQYLIDLNLIRLLGLSIWYAFVLTNFLPLPARWWLIIALTVGLVGFSQFSRRHHYYSTERYYRLLSSQELRWELERRRQRLARSSSLWVVGASIYLALSRDDLVFPPVTEIQLSLYVLVLIAVLVLVGVFVDYVQWRRWKHLLSQHEYHPGGEELSL